MESLRKKIELVEEMQFTLDYHDSRKRSASSALRVSLKDGPDLDEVLVEYPAGHPWREDTLELVKSKFEKNTRGWFGEGEKTDDILKLAAIEEDKFRSMNVCDFVDYWAS